MFGSTTSASTADHGGNSSNSSHYHHSNHPNQQQQGGSNINKEQWNPKSRGYEQLNKGKGHAPRKKNVIHWFRNKGLRLHDNPALKETLQGAHTFRCVYILDPWFAATSQAGINKWRFLLHCLEDLDNSLRKLNSRLYVIRGQPTSVFPRVFREWNITTLSFEVDPEPFGKERDQAICAIAREAKVHVVKRVSHTLYPLEKIIKMNNDQVPLTYRRFQNVLAGMESPPQPTETITEETIGSAYTELSPDHDELYGVPSLQSLGFDTEGLGAAVWKGGETEALTRLTRHLERKAWVASFEKPKMTVQSLMASPTGLSPYLRFGCLSPRLFYYRLTDLHKKIKKQSKPLLSLYGQLLWREFFYCAATNNANFDRMMGNPICVQIPWDHHPEALAKWAEGKTGFPWIDAIMTQLRQEGWIHHLARHSVACFLTRGDLWLSWEEGAKVFDELLLDADWSSNAGSWMWLSCSSFFQQFFHSYCPTNFGKATDPEGNYIRKYLPVLKGYPAKYIYEPWTAPIEVQQAAKCLIGLDYPVPMVNHAEASRINMQRMMQVYQKFRYGPFSRILKQSTEDQHKQGSTGNHVSKMSFATITETPMSDEHSAKRQRTSNTDTQMTYSAPTVDAGICLQPQSMHSVD